MWTLLLQPYPNSTTNSKIRKYFFLFPQFLDFIPQLSMIRTHRLSLIYSLFPAGRSRSVVSRSFKSFLTRIVCSQYFLLENFAMVRSLSSPWQASVLYPEIFTPIWCRIRQAVGSSWSCWTGEGIPTISTHFRREYCEFFQRWRSTELSCLTKA